MCNSNEIAYNTYNSYNTYSPTFALCSFLSNKKGVPKNTLFLFIALPKTIAL